MTRSILLGAVAFATIATVPSIPAQAQGAPDDNTIVIEGPRVQQTRRSGSVHPERVLTASSLVYYDDLALNTEYGRDALRDRVRDAAEETCGMLNDVYPADGAASDHYRCIRKAVSSARSQVNAAISRYYYG